MCPNNSSEGTSRIGAIVEENDYPDEMIDVQTYMNLLEELNIKLLDIVEILNYDPLSLDNSEYSSSESSSVDEDESETYTF